jgi:hypothetical protein
LRSCNIVVEIEHDITPHLDRAIELINRTNQLNFIKSRLPEDPQQATQDLTTRLARHDVQAGLVRVIDRYGDHGYCGIYILRMPRRLLQFTFSCRILGMGVERWLYQRLGRPHLEVQGEVLSDAVHDVSPIDWIQIRGSTTSVNGSAAEQKGWISARGSCDLRAVGHYFSLSAFRSSGEFNMYRKGCDVRIDHSMFLRYAITGLPPDGMDVCKHLGYCEEDFRTALLDQRSGIAVWLLSFWSDASFAVYRHRETGVVVPFSFPKWHQAKDVREASLDDIPAEDDRSGFVDSLGHLKENFDYMGGDLGSSVQGKSKDHLERSATQYPSIHLRCQRTPLGSAGECPPPAFGQQVAEPMDSGGDSVAEECGHSQHPRLRRVRYRGP